VLPDDAVTSTAATDVTFRFAAPGSGCYDADNNYTAEDFSSPTVTYSTVGDSITRNGDPMLDNASMTVDFIPTGAALTATAVRVTIVVSDARTTTPEPLADRTFSATYEMRNRL
jgi:hypothetical protein